MPAAGVRGGMLMDKGFAVARTGSGRLLRGDICKAGCGVFDDGKKGRVAGDGNARWCST